MDYKYIEQLINRYFDAETTCEEEQILRLFFAQQEIPAELACWKPLFQALEAEAAETLSEEFDAKVLHAVGMAGEDKPFAVLGEVQARPLPLSLRLRPFFRAVAAVAVVFLVGTAAEQSLSVAGSEAEATSAHPSFAVAADSLPATYEKAAETAKADSAKLIRELVEGIKK